MELIYDVHDIKRTYPGADIREQLGKIQEEYAELLETLENDEPINRKFEELNDLIQASINLMPLILEKEGCSNWMIGRLSLAHRAKMDDRAYYKI